MVRDQQGGRGVFMFTRSFPLFTLFGFRISIDLSWFVLAALIVWSLATGMFPESLPERSARTYYIMGAAGALGMFASIVFHEMAHSLVARAYGIKIAGITLFIFGGVAELEDEPPTPKSEFLVAIAGPISSIVLGGALFLVASLFETGGPAEVLAVLDYLTVINIVLAVFNLIPAFPLDGGRMLRAVLWWRQGDLRKATRLASFLGAGLGIALMAFGAYSALQGSSIGGLWQILIGYFVFNAAGNARRQTEIVERLRGVSVGQLMRTPPNLPAGFPAEPFAEGTLAPDQSAIAALRQLLRRPPSEALVLADGKAVGVIGARDIFAFLNRQAASRSAANEQRDPGRA
jgi:Zn-dependent protease